MRLAWLLRSSVFVVSLLTVTQSAVAQRPPRPNPRLAQYKQEVVADVAARARFTQQMVDQIFSFGELGFQEFETSKYVVNILRQNGFTVEENYAGIPTAWVATWGSGKPVISLGSDIDGIPQASQMPGVACHLPMIPGAPGHGEGHNSGQGVNLTAALAVKQIMERERLAGTLQLWPGVAEEQLGTKAYYVRQGMLRDVDVVIFTHVGNNLGVSWGIGGGNGLVSLLYAFEGRSAHSAGAPWRGRSALDAVSLMEIGWQFRREHLRLPQRSHSVIVDGGDQPNVVPPTASIWFYLRELDYPNVMNMWAIADSIAQGAAMMTGTRLAGTRVLGSAWPRNFSKVVAEAVYENIKTVGLPQWSEADLQLARGIQQDLGVREEGLATELDELEAPIPLERQMGGGSDDIGDISWNVPTTTLRFPSNVPGTPGHNWSNAIAMATPIAHKGATAGAKVLAMSVLDFLTRPELVAQAWEQFRTVQLKDMQYKPLIRPGDQPAIELNRDILAKYRDEMRKFYYDPSRYGTYLEQLGVAYPTVRSPDGRCGPVAVP
jgi:aminobenzoyl-glutamate utilization protein B